MRGKSDGVNDKAKKMPANANPTCEKDPDNRLTIDQIRVVIVGKGFAEVSLIGSDSKCSFQKNKLYYERTNSLFQMRLDLTSLVWHGQTGFADMTGLEYGWPRELYLVELN